MSAPANTQTDAPVTSIRVRHIATVELGRAWSLCGLPRLNRPPVFDLGPDEELCVVCATEYERIRGFRWEDRHR